VVHEAALVVCERNDVRERAIIDALANVGARFAIVAKAIEAIAIIFVRLNLHDSVGHDEFRRGRRRSRVFVIKGNDCANFYRRRVVMLNHDTFANVKRIRFRAHH